MESKKGGERLWISEALSEMGRWEYNMYIGGRKNQKPLNRKGDQLWKLKQ